MSFKLKRRLIIVNAMQDIEIKDAKMKEIAGGIAERVIKIATKRLLSCNCW